MVIELSGVQFIRVVSKSNDYSLNRTPLGPITITNIIIKITISSIVIGLKNPIFH